MDYTIRLDFTELRTLIGCLDIAISLSHSHGFRLRSLREELRRTIDTQRRAQNEVANRRGVDGAYIIEE